jgi:hypothetical protein
MSTPRPPGGVRRRVRAPRGPAAWPALALVAVTVLSLVLAGRVEPPAPAAADRTGAPTQVERTLVCPGGLPSARVESGTTGAAGQRGTRVQEATLPRGGNAREVVTEAGRAAGAFATQVARGEGWLAAVPCPEPRQEWWFVGLGGGQVHRSELLVANPREGDAVVDVEVLGPRGRVDAPGLDGMSVPAGTTRRLDLREVAPSSGDLAVRVTTSRGLVAVVAADSQVPDLIGDRVREWVTPQPAAARQATLTGVPDEPDEATALVANPGAVEALVEVRAVGSRGTFTPRGTGPLRVGPGEVRPLPLDAVFDGEPVAVSLDSTAAVVATVRSFVDGDVTHAGAPVRSADGAVLGVPARTRAELRLSSPRAAGRVRVTPYTAAGRALRTRTVSIDAGSTAGLPLPARARSVALRASSPRIVAGLVLTATRGVGSAVFEAAQEAARSPAVRPG